MVLIAGGMGVVPLLGLAEELSRETRDERRETIIGARTKRELLCVPDFKRLGFDVHIATDDGSRGFKGLATDLLKNKFSSIAPRPSPLVYACGPKPMLKQVAEIVKGRRASCQVSLEENMGCGVGACLGCVVKTKSGYKRVCKDGPVFDVGQIVWR